jgi:hypothetical protein
LSRDNIVDFELGSRTPPPDSLPAIRAAWAPQV